MCGGKEALQRHEDSQQESEEDEEEYVRASEGVNSVGSEGGGSMDDGSDG